MAFVAAPPPASLRLARRAACAPPRRARPAGARAPPRMLDAIDTDARPVGAADLKRDLLAAVAGANRGLAAGRAGRAEVLALVRELEGVGRGWVPPAGGAGEDALVGTWRLVFTNAPDVLSLALLPVLLGQIYQNVEADGEGRYMLYNVVEVEPVFAPLTNAFDALGPSQARIRVSAEGRLAGGAAGAPRLDLTFVRSALEGVSLLGLDVSALPAVGVPVNARVGYFETTFIDDELRIARSPPTPNSPNTNNYFVLLRER